MASRIVDKSKSVDYNDVFVYCDVYEDLADVDTSEIEQGSTAYILSGASKGNVYMLLSTKKWEIQ